jgi:hypothetical protein
MQAKNLEELELQQPFIERTLRPLMASLSGRMSRTASASFTEKTEKRLALAGNPGDLRVADWLGVKAIGAIVGGILFACCSGSSDPGLPVPIGSARHRRGHLRVRHPRVLARRPRQEAPEGDPLMIPDTSTC